MGGKAKLKPGTPISLQQIGYNKRQAKVYAKGSNGLGVTGWISLATPGGDPLVGKVSGKAKDIGDIHFLPKYAKIKSLLEAAVGGDLLAFRKLVESGNGIASKSSTAP